MSHLSHRLQRVSWHAGRRTKGSGRTENPQRTRKAHVWNEELRELKTSHKQNGLQRTNEQNAQHPRNGKPRRSSRAKKDGEGRPNQGTRHRREKSEPETPNRADTKTRTREGSAAAPNRDSTPSEQSKRRREIPEQPRPELKWCKQGKIEESNRRHMYWGAQNERLIDPPSSTDRIT